jgi:hypothetical protein
LNGPSIIKDLQDIEVSFDKLVYNLSSLDYDILDVKVTPLLMHNLFNSSVGQQQVAQ